LIRHRRIEQVLHSHMPLLNENNAEDSSFGGSPIEYPSPNAATLQSNSSSLLPVKATRSRP
jgi:hypothetical protein